MTLVIYDLYLKSLHQSQSQVSPPGDTDRKRAEDGVGDRIIEV